MVSTKMIRTGKFMANTQVLKGKLCDFREGVPAARALGRIGNSPADVAALGSQLKNMLFTDTYGGSLKPMAVNLKLALIEAIETLAAKNEECRTVALSELRSWLTEKEAGEMSIHWQDGAVGPIIRRAAMDAFARLGGQRSIQWGG